MEKNQNFDHVAGNARYIEVDLSDVPDLTGTVIKWVLKKNENDTSYLVFKSTQNGGISISDPTSQVFLIHLVDVDTMNLSRNVYYHEASLIDAAGEESTLFNGTMNLKTNAIRKSGL